MKQPFGFPILISPENYEWYENWWRNFKNQNRNLLIKLNPEKYKGKEYIDMPIVQVESGLLYLNVSCGYLVNTKKEIKERAYLGKLVGIRQEMDEYEGKEIPKIKCLMDDGEGRALITFFAEGWYAKTFFERITRINLDEPFIIGVSGGKNAKGEESKVSFCWMKQDGNEHLNKNGAIEPDPDFPKPATKNTMRKGKVIGTEKDWTPILERIDTIMEDLMEQVGTGEKGSDSQEVDSPKVSEDDVPF